MEQLTILIAALAVTIFIGFNLLYIILGRFNDIHIGEGIALSFALGLGAVTVEMLLFYLAGMKFDIARLVVPWFLPVSVSIYFVSVDTDSLSFMKDVRSRTKETGLLSAFFLGAISVEVIYAFFRALIKPIEAYDAIAIYAIKSKIFFLAKAIPADFFSGMIHSFPHPDYPLNIPLAETFLYMCMGALNEQLVKLIFPIFFVGILALLYYAIRRFASKTYALLFTFMLATVPQFNAYAANAYQELPLAFYYFASAIFLFDWLEDRSEIRKLVLSAVMAGLAAWTKNEGLMYCIINLFLVASFCLFDRKESPLRSLSYPILYISISFAIAIPWTYIKHKYGISNEEINLANLNPAYLAGQLHKIGPVFYELQKQLFGPKKWNILWPVAIAAGLYYHRRLLSGRQRYMTVSILLSMCGYVVFYMISYVDVVFFASKTWSRFLLHFLPLLVLWLAFLFKEDINI